jgi:hypothetical protein
MATLRFSREIRLTTHALSVRIHLGIRQITHHGGIPFGLIMGCGAGGFSRRRSGDAIYRLCRLFAVHRH